MDKHFLIFLVLVLSLAFSPGSALAQESKKDILSGKDFDNKEVCGLIKDNLKRGVDAKAVTKTNIQLGHNTCYVMKCAIDGGGALRLVIAGAIEAGSTADVVTKCSVNAGADPAMIAQILQSLGEGLGYSPPPGDQLVPMAIPTGTATGGGFISPSAF